MNIKNHTKEKLHDISKVIENPRNPNKHSDSQIAMLSKIIEFQGWRIPIVVSNRSGFIVRGHGRLMSARKLGLEEVPVSFQDYESEAQEWADLIADNRIAELAEMDRSELKDIIQQLDTGEIDLDLTGFDQESLEDLMSEFFEPEDGLTDDDKIPEDVEARCNLGDLWQLGDHRLMCGDSTNEQMVEFLLENKKADITFSDPPYGVDYDGGIQFTNSGVKKGSRQKLINDDSDIYEKVIPIFARHTNFAIYTWFAGTKALSLYKSIDKVGEISALIIWEKNGGYSAMNAHYKQKHEPCIYWKAKNSSMKWNGSSKENTIWTINKDGKNNFHPTQKPIELACRAIGNHKAESVLDLFLGSGSTLIACEKLKRKCFGMELDPHYCDVIIQRWEDFTGKKAEKIN